VLLILRPLPFCIKLKLPRAACDYGDPQIRPRLIILAAKHFVECPKRPSPTHVDPRLGKEVVGGPQGKAPFVTVGNVIEQFRHSKSYPNMDVMKTTNSKPGDPDTEQLKADRLAPAVLASGPRIFHYMEDRCISVREAAALQSFPNHYEFFGTQTEQYKQVGNSVPCNLARAIAKSIDQSLRFVYREELETKQKASSTEVVGIVSSAYHRKNDHDLSVHKEADTKNDHSSSDPMRLEDKAEFIAKRSNLDQKDISSGIVGIDSSSDHGKKYPDHSIRNTPEANSENNPCDQGADRMNLHLEETAESRGEERKSEKDESMPKTDDTSKDDGQYTHKDGAANNNQSSCDTEDGPVDLEEEKKADEKERKLEEDEDMEEKDDPSYQDDDLVDTDDEELPEYCNEDSDSTGPSSKRRRLSKMMSTSSSSATTTPIDDTLKPAEKHILETVGQLVAIGMSQPSRDHVQKFSGYATKQAGYDKNLGQLRKKGYLEFPDRKSLALTTKGTAQVGEVDTSNVTNEAYQDKMKELLPPKARSILDALADGQVHDREELAQQLHYDMDKLTGYHKNISQMKTFGFVDYVGSNTIQLSDGCFPMGRPGRPQSI
jgi:hypothetical protein